MEPSLLITLKGHRGQVSSIQSTDNEQFFISGSDDKSVRIWDLRVNKTVKCLSGCFPDSVSNIYSKSIDTFSLVATSGSNLFTFDLRTDSIIIRASSSTYSDFPDDISSISIDPKNGNNLAISDDSGSISIFDCIQQKITKRLSRGHENICSCTSFHPYLSNVLVSGGFDSRLFFWDTLRGRPKSTIDFNNHSGGSQISNPPFVHELKYIVNGRAVVCALGDGTIRTVNCSNNNHKHQQSKSNRNNNEIEYIHSIDAHSGLVSALSLLGEQIIVSGGIDGKIHAWKMETSHSLNNNNSNTDNIKSTKSKYPPPTSSSHLDRQLVVTLMDHPLWSIQHDIKINALLSTSFLPAASTSPSLPAVDSTTIPTTTTMMESSYPYNSKLFVADVSNDISVYTIL